MKEALIVSTFLRKMTREYHKGGINRLAAHAYDRLKRPFFGYSLPFVYGKDFFEDPNNIGRPMADYLAPHGDPWDSTRD